MTGDCVLELRNGRIWIKRADPKTRISAESLAETSASPHSDVTLNGDVLTINAENGKVIYRIGELDPSGLWYDMEWPD